jgi:cytochrome c5
MFFKQLIIKCTLLCLLPLPLLASCPITGSLSVEAITKRLIPPGVATITRSDGASQAPAAVELSTGARIYKNSCTACHSMGIAGAPKFKDKAAWDLRLKKGMDTLITHIRDGYKAMPAGGACPQCSDQDYKDAIEYMRTGK